MLERKKRSEKDKKNRYSFSGIFISSLDKKYVRDWNWMVPFVKSFVSILEDVFEAILSNLITEIVDKFMQDMSKARSWKYFQGSCSCLCLHSLLFSLHGLKYLLFSLHALEFLLFFLYYYYYFSLFIIRKKHWVMT